MEGRWEQSSPCPSRASAAHSLTLGEPRKTHHNTVELASCSITTSGMSTQKCHPHINQSDTAHSILLRQGHPVAINMCHQPWAHQV